MSPTPHTHSSRETPEHDVAAHVAVGSFGSSAVEPASEREQPATEPSGRGASRLLNTTGGRVILGAVVPVVMLAAWYLSTALGVFSPVQLPSPTAVWSAGVELMERGELGPHIGISTQRVLLGFAIGGLVGLAAGSLVGLSRLADALLSPTIGAFRAVPSLAWVPLLILWMKIGEDSKVTLIAIGAFFPVFTTVYLALRHVDKNLIEAARAFGMRGVKLLTAVQLPAVVPSIFSGLRLALAQAWLFLVAAELIASSMGLGFLLTDSQYNGRTDRLILTIILLAVIGKLSDAVLGLVERWAIKRWT
ncbi:ABC transporter permease [Zhihengliuella flava]|uniref:Sulfonate transport system permease protein n=1 Tax=Zhihengliuella flava TaxID=1285193 RepID=A0A931DCL4_9MICC|nr:ABC transporter permease [Zhihengliuella flava]MBG6084971.1 sulfonate transport system permease protein [Zhihengliuella flava]